jgi:hypothetical protein
VITSFGTPNSLSTLSRVLRLFFINIFPFAILFSSINKFLYLSHVQVNSAGFEIESIIVCCLTALDKTSSTNDFSNSCYKTSSSINAFDFGCSK